MVVVAAAAAGASVGAPVVGVGAFGARALAEVMPGAGPPRTGAGDDGKIEGF